MEIACPSCGALFEAEEAEAALPGVPVCDACKVRADSDAPGRRTGQRPKAPLLSLDSAEVKIAMPDVDEQISAETDSPSGDGELVSMSELEVVPVSEPQKSKPISVRGLDAGFSPGDQEGEPVSLKELEVVLSPVAAPPPWLGGGEAQAPRPGARPAVPVPPPLPRAPEAPPAGAPAMDLGQAMAMAAAEPPPPFGLRRRRPAIVMEGLSPRPPDSSMADLAAMEALCPPSARSPVEPKARIDEAPRPRDSSIADLEAMAALAPPTAPAKAREPEPEEEAPRAQRPARVAAAPAAKAAPAKNVPAKNVPAKNVPAKAAPAKAAPAKTAPAPSPARAAVKVAPAPEPSVVEELEDDLLASIRDLAPLTAPDAPPPLPAKPAAKAAASDEDPSLIRLKSDPPPAPRADDDEDAPTSGLLDIRSLAESVAGHGAEPEEQRTDADLFNLSGGIFAESAPPLKPVDLSSLLASPIVEPPPDSGAIPIAPVLDVSSLRGMSSRPPPAAAPVVSERRATAAAAAAAERGILANRAVVIAAVGVAAVVAAFWFGRGSNATSNNPAPTTAKPEVAPTQVAPTQVAEVRPPPPVDNPSPPAIDPGATPAKLTPSASATAAAAAPSTRASATPAAGKPTGDPGRPPPDQPKPPVAQPPAPPPTAAVVAPPPPPPSTGAEFDKNAARAALNAAAGTAAGCKAPDDPTGGAKVQVTFAPSGRVTTARVTGPPFQGTKTGGCIASTFRGASVPPFDGAAVTVTKDVIIR